MHKQVFVLEIVKGIVNIFGLSNHVSAFTDSGVLSLLQGYKKQRNKKQDTVVKWGKQVCMVPEVNFQSPS